MQPVNQPLVCELMFYDAADGWVAEWLEEVGASFTVDDDQGLVLVESWPTGWQVKATDSIWSIVDDKQAYRADYDPIDQTLGLLERY